MLDKFQRDAFSDRAELAQLQWEKLAAFIVARKIAFKEMQYLMPASMDVIA